MYVLHNWILKLEKYPESERHDDHLSEEKRSEIDTIFADNLSGVDMMSGDGDSCRMRDLIKDTFF